MVFQVFSRILALEFQSTTTFTTLRSDLQQLWSSVGPWRLGFCALKKQKLMELFCSDLVSKNCFFPVVAKYKATSIGTAIRSGKVKSVVEGDLTAIGNISETMDWGGGGGGAGRCDGTSCSKTRELCSS